MRFQSSLISTTVQLFARAWSSAVKLPEFRPAIVSPFAHSVGVMDQAHQPGPGTSTVHSSICKSPSGLPKARIGRRPINFWMATGLPAHRRSSLPFGMLRRRCLTRSSAKASWTYIGCSHQSVPSLSNTAMRSATGTKAGEPWFVTFATKSGWLALPCRRFQDASGSAARMVGAIGKASAMNRTDKSLFHTGRFLLR